jgi:hypothetical protein
LRHRRKTFCPECGKAIIIIVILIIIITQTTEAGEKASGVCGRKGNKKGESPLEETQRKFLFGERKGNGNVHKQTAVIITLQRVSS